MVIRQNLLWSLFESNFSLFLLLKYLDPTEHKKWQKNCAFITVPKTNFCKFLKNKVPWSSGSSKKTSFEYQHTQAGNSNLFTFFQLSNEENRQKILWSNFYRSFFGTVINAHFLVIYFFLFVSHHDVINMTSRFKCFCFDFIYLCSLWTNTIIHWQFNCV